MGQDQAILTYRVGRCCAGRCSSGSPDPERVKKTPPTHRSAGACPPQCLPMARDRPSPYGNREPLSVVRDRPIPKRVKKTSPHRSAGACPPRCSTSGLPLREPFFFAHHLFRSFRTLMSIETVSDSFSRSVRTLITRGAPEVKKRLRSSRTLGLFLSVRCYRHAGPNGPEELGGCLPGPVRDQAIPNYSYVMVGRRAAAARTVFFRAPPL